MDQLVLHAPVVVRSSMTSCWKCHQRTPVHAIVAREVHDPADGPYHPSEDACRSFVYDIAAAHMPSPMAAALSVLAPTYRPTWSQSLGETVWANRCTHCDALQGAWFLHSEPNGPFFGGPDAAPPGTEQKLSADDVAVRDASYSL